MPIHGIKARTSYMPKWTPKSGDGCVLYLNGQQDPQSGVIKDLSGYGNHGTITGATWVRDKYGMWVNYLDGTTNIITTPLATPSLNLLSTISGQSANQGIATDGTYFYLISNSSIQKYDNYWNLIATNSNAGTEAGVNHVSDGCVYNGKLYCACENYPAVTDMRISVWNTSDLSWVSNNDISAQAFECASLVVDAPNDRIYVVSFDDGTKFLSYKLSDFSYVGATNFSAAFTNPQGITMYGGYLYIHEDSGNAIYRVKLDGTIVGGALATTANEAEGIDFTTGTLYALSNTGGANQIRTYQAPYSFPYVTAMCWFKQTAAQAYNPVLMCKGANATTTFYMAGGSDSDEIYFYCVNNTNHSRAFSAALNQWHFVACSYDGANVNFVYDGIVLAPVAQTGPLNINTNALTVGNRATADRGFKGYINLSRAYPIALPTPISVGIYQSERVLFNV